MPADVEGRHDDQLIEEPDEKQLQTERQKADGAESEHGADAVPDGGFGWVIVFGATMTHFLLVGMARCLGVIYLCLRERYQASAANTAWVAAAFNTSRTLTAPLASMLCEKFGCRLVAFCGGLLFSAGLIISAFSTSLIFMLFSFGILSGLGGVLIFTPAYIMVGQYFNKRKGTAMGLATVGSGIGNVVLAPLINYLLNEFGFFGSMLILGAIALHTCAVALVYRPRKKTKKKKTENGKTSSQCCRCAVGKNSILRNSTFIIYCFLMAGMQYAIMGTLVFVPEFAVEKGSTKTEASLLLSIYGFVDMSCRFIYAFLFDLPFIRLQRRLPFALVGVLFGVSTIVISFMPSYLPLALSVAFNALFEAGFHSQRATVISEFVSQSQMSMAVGMMIASQGVGNISGPPFAGFLRDIYGTNQVCFIFGGGCFLLSALSFLVKILFDLKQTMSKKIEIEVKVNENKA